MLTSSVDTNAPGGCTSGSPICELPSDVVSTICAARKESPFFPAGEEDKGTGWVKTPPLIDLAHHESGLLMFRSIV